MLPPFPGFLLKYHPKETSYPISIHTEKEEFVCYHTYGFLKVNHKPYYAVTYAIVYKDNPAIGLGHCFCPTSETLGYHHGDVERITLLYDMEPSLRKEPLKVYFNAHSRGQGTLLDYNACEKSPDGQLVVYIARGSHASYPKPGTYWRIMGVANDVCRNNGRSIHISTSLPIVNKIISRSGIILDCLVVQVPSRSATAWERFWLPFYVKKLRSLA